MGLAIQGHSDDIIGISGDITEEFRFDQNEEWIILPYGVIIEVRFDQRGTWRFTEVNNSPNLRIIIDRAPVGAEETSDLVTVYGHVAWIARAVEFHAAREGAGRDH